MGNIEKEERERICAMMEMTSWRCCLSPHIATFSSSQLYRPLLEFGLRELDLRLGNGSRCK